MAMLESESIDRMNEELHRLFGNNEIHFNKRRKILLQLERKNNQFRRFIDQFDFETQRKLTLNSDLIRHIKKKIIEENRQENQRRRNQHEQNRNWSLGGMITAISMVVIGVISIATLIIILLDRSREKYISFFS
jgi:hypothetical protein